jgi:hypothetical protein
MLAEEGDRQSVDGAEAPHTVRKSIFPTRNKGHISPTVIRDLEFASLSLALTTNVHDRHKKR